VPAGPVVVARDVTRVYEIRHGAFRERARSNEY
jgi:hypothetical protein